MGSKKRSGMGNRMNEKFFDLKKEKQDRMINASLKIFAWNGYAHASTDDIVKEAGISKGLLFHYFGSKLGLYSFIFDYSVRYMTLELTTGVYAKETDYYRIMKQILAAKLQVLKNYPYMIQFLNRCSGEDVKEALEATEDKRYSLSDLYGNIMARADREKFKKEVEIDKLTKMIRYTEAGMMTESFRSGSFQPEQLHAEITHYLTMLKKMTYLEN